VSRLVPPARRRILVGFDANVQKLLDLRLEDYAFVHVSTHALIDDRIPELSRVALSMVTPTGRPINGFLRPIHLSALRLGNSTVVLSACDTALGKQVVGEGLMGLTASLFYAGASQLVLSLSEVDSEGSSAFFTEVYSRVFGPPRMATEHALTLARRSLSQSTRWSDPYYWASFILYGRPTGG
jgi:CHAT domain-containing protein